MADLILILVIIQINLNRVIGALYLKTSFIKIPRTPSFLLVTLNERHVNAKG